MSMWGLHSGATVLETAGVLKDFMRVLTQVEMRIHPFGLCSRRMPKSHSWR